MLKKGSLLGLNDTTGAISIKILNIKKKKFFDSVSVKVLDIIIGVVQDFDVFKKKPLLKNKSRTEAMVVAVKKKYSKKNGIYIRFSHNRCVPLKITRFTVPLAHRVYTPMFYEIKLFKRFKVVAKSSRYLF